MQTVVEVVVPKESRVALTSELGDIPHTHVVTAPSHRGNPSRLCMTTLREFDRPGIDISAWLTGVRHAAGESWPFVIRWETVPSARRRAAVQSVANLAAQLHLPIFLANDRATLRRVVQARLQQAEDQLIAAAELNGRVLEVWSCEPRLYRVPLEKLPALQGLSEHSLESFSVSGSGNRLHWDSGDIDINMDSIRAAVDVGVRREQRRRYREESDGYGRAIRELRLERGLKQTDLAGLPERTVRRVETGGTLPRLSTLEKLAAGHRMTTDAYLSELARRLPAKDAQH